MVFVAIKLVVAACGYWTVQIRKRTCLCVCVVLVWLTDEIINGRAKIMMMDWKLKYEVDIRQDAIRRSTAVHTGKVTEHFIPFMKGFGYNVRDVRFVGSPIDLIVFDGHYDQSDEITILFIEVKTGKSKLSAAQRKIKDAVLNNRVQWREMGNDIELPKD